MLKTTLLSLTAVALLSFGVAPGATTAVEAKTSTQIKQEQRSKATTAKREAKQANRNAVNKAKRASKKK